MRAGANHSEGRLPCDLGRVSKEELFERFRTDYGLADMDEAELPAAPVDIALNPHFLKAHWLLPLADEGDTLQVATADPTDQWALNALAFAAGKPLSLVLADEDMILAHVKQLYFPDTDTAPAGAVLTALVPR